MVQRRISETRIRASVLRVLRATNLCSMATVSRGNRAHINTAFFAISPAWEAYFLSDPQSLHCRNLTSNPSMAMTIFDSRQNWEDPGRGIQLFGTARRTYGRQARIAEAVYANRFPSFARWLKGLSAAKRRQAALLRSYAFLRFSPSLVKILDESEFGGAVFIVAKVFRRRTREGPLKAVLRWQATELLVPDANPAEKT